MSSNTLIEKLELRQLLSVGGLDTTFDSTGTLTIPLFAQVTRVLVQPDQKIVVASQQDTLLHGAGIVSRLLPSGSFDSTFKAADGSSSGYELSSLTSDIALTSTNEIIGLGGNSLMELLPSGSHDPGFGVHGTAIPGTGLRMGLTQSNQIIVAYTATNGGLFVRRYGADGTWDTAYGNGGDTAITNRFSGFSFNEIAVAFDGKAVLFGSYTDGTTHSFAAIRLKANGQIDPTFGNDGLATVAIPSVGAATTGYITPDNRILIGGQLNNQVAVVELTDAGQVDTTFGSSGWVKVAEGRFSEVRSIASGPDGKIYLAGESQSVFLRQPAETEVIRLSQTGSLDTSFNGSGIAMTDPANAYSGATSIVVGSNNRVIVGGYTGDATHFTQANRFAMEAYQGGGVTNDNNDQISEASTISLSSTTTGTINSRDDVDIKKFTVVAGQRESFEVDQPNNDYVFDPYLKIFKSDGTLVVANDGGFSPTAITFQGAPVPLDPYLDYTFPSAGTYYVALSSNPDTNYNPLTGADGTSLGYGGAYSLKLTNLTNTPNSHDKLSTAVSPAYFGAVTSAIISSTDVLMVKFKLNAGSTVSINLNKVEGDFDSYLRLFNSAGQQLTANDNGAAPNEPASKDSFIKYTATTAGTYYIGISTNKNKNYNPVTGSGDVGGGAIGSFNVFFSGISVVLTPQG